MTLNIADQDFTIIKDNILLFAKEDATDYAKAKAQVETEVNLLQRLVKMYNKFIEAPDLETAELLLDESGTALNISMLLDEAFYIMNGAVEVQQELLELNEGSNETKVELEKKFSLWNSNLELNILALKA